MKKKKNVKMHVQRKKWRPHNINALCWSFHCINDNSNVDEKVLQIMKCFSLLQKSN
jgi:hypothetical protein